MRISTILSIVLISFKLLLTESLAADPIKVRAGKETIEPEIFLCLVKKAWGLAKN